VRPKPLSETDNPPQIRKTGGGFISYLGKNKTKLKSPELLSPWLCKLMQIKSGAVVEWMEP
jgi:hypothetical protein